jgi:hypothetical protein
VQGVADGAARCEDWHVRPAALRAPILREFGPAKIRAEAETALDAFMRVYGI